MNTILLYIINSEQEIPANPLPNTAYYIVGKQVVIYDNLNQKSVFNASSNQAPEAGVDSRLAKCEEAITQITTYLGSFKPFNGGN